MDTLLIVFLTLLNGAFAMSELALASSRKARLTTSSTASGATQADSADGVRCDHTLPDEGAWQELSVTGTPSKV